MPVIDVNRARHHEMALAHLSSPFGADRFGRAAEWFARAFGTPQFIVGQTVIDLLWIGLNAVALTFRWDPYPFILLNLTFSLQAAYAAPLILLAQTREADRDKLRADADAGHREKLAQRALEQERETQAMTERVRALLEANTRLTEEVHRLTREIHSRFNLAAPSQIVTTGSGWPSLVEPALTQETIEALGFGFFAPNTRQKHQQEHQ